MKAILCDICRRDATWSQTIQFRGDPGLLDPKTAHQVRHYDMCTEHAQAFLRSIGPANLAQSGIFSDVLTERAQQDQQWGGPEHDDTHNLDEWLIFVQRQIDGIAYREMARPQLIKVAALIFAAVESLDRKAALQARAPEGVLVAN